MTYLYAIELKRWLEQTIGKQIMNGHNPVFIGYKNGRKIYSIDFIDKTSEDFFIDFREKEIEKIS